MKVMYLTIELMIGFFLLFIIVKLVGKKIINQITPFTFIASIVLGELLGNAVYDHQIGAFYIIYSMVLWGGLLFIVEYLGQKFLAFRGIFEGKPSALIKNGKVDYEELKKNRMNINQLQSLLRQSETFSIREVAFCYLEANGSISILKKSKYQKTTQGDFNMSIKPVYVPVTLIRDGKVLWDELNDLGFNESWLKTQLKSQGISDYKDVFLAEWLEDDGLFVQTY
ncbi:YetF domain-containing protein [Aeribacillus pallidus]|uniref:YetF domain-containing protein n=1 Tax=Aeribacillus pallidus TaxID=33936 RepID=UPI003D252929